MDHIFINFTILLSLEMLQPVTTFKILIKTTYYYVRKTYCDNSYVLLSESIELKLARVVELY